MSSATDSLGSHLLGRNPHPGDPRDYRLADYLGATPLEAALAALKKSAWVAGSVKKWATLVTAAIEGAQPSPPTPTPPAPTPTPTPPQPPPAPSGGVEWADSDTRLDQGQTPHCVGFGGADWENTLPVDDHATNADGDAIYYACKVVDGEPQAEDGSTVHSLATVLKNRGRLTAYAWTSSTDEITQWLEQHGPVVVGTDWDNSMFSPDGDNFIVPDGNVAGGHCYVLVGYEPATKHGPAYRLLNSWGASWGDNGTAFIAVNDFASLLARAGSEAMAAVELP